MNLRAILIASMLAGGALASLPAQATSMVELSDTQLVTASEQIVRGTVQEIWTERGSDGAVWTRVQLDVTEVLKGDATMDSVVVDQLGGSWAGQGLEVPGSARFDVGEEVLLYLEQLGSGHIVCVGMEQGKYTLKLDPVSRELVAFRVQLPLKRAYDHRFYPLPPEASRVTLDEVRASVRQAHAAGWDGVPLPGVSPDELQRRARIALPAEVK